PFATAVIVFAEKPTSGKVGDKAIITSDGTLYGWIGGSCAQPTVSKEAVKSLSDGESRLIRLSPNPAEMKPREGVLDLQMTCFSGRTLDVCTARQYPPSRCILVRRQPGAQALVPLGDLMSYEVIVAGPDNPSNHPDHEPVISELSKIGN